MNTGREQTESHAWTTNYKHTKKTNRSNAVSGTEHNWTKKTRTNDSVEV